MGYRRSVVVARSTTRTRLLLAVLATVSLVAMFSTRVSRKMPDFEVYWTAGSRARAAAPLYRVEDGHYQFKYLPAFALFASPLSGLSLPKAKALWFALSAILMVLLLWLSLLALPLPRHPPPLLAVLTFAAMAKFYAHELVLGQVNLLFAVIVTLALVLLRRQGALAAGALFAIAVVVKPYAILFAPWLASRRSRRAAAAMAVAFAGLLLLPAAVYGWAGNLQLLRAWWSTVTATTAPNLLNQDNVSLAAFCAKWLGPGGPATTLAGVATAILLGLAAIVVAGRGALPAPDALEASLLLALIPLASPQGWDYVFLVATPGVMLLMNEIGALPRGLRLASAAAIVVVAFSIYDLMGRDAYATFMRLSIVTICFVVEYVALVVLRFRRAA
jgi:hypothetical protein